MRFNYNKDKDDYLIKERGFGFNELIFEIQNGKILDITKHPNVEKYPKQEVMYVNIGEVAYVVPYVIENDGSIFLKTLYPSRKATKKYLRGKK